MKSKKAISGSGFGNWCPQFSKERTWKERFFFLSFLLFEFVVSAKWGYLRPSCRGVPGVDKLPSLWFRDTGHHWRLQLPGSNLEGLFFGLKNNSRSHFARYRQREEEGIGPCEQQRMNMFSNGRMRRGFK